MKTALPSQVIVVTYANSRWEITHLQKSGPEIGLEEIFLLQNNKPRMCLFFFVLTHCRVWKLLPKQ